MPREADFVCYWHEKARAMVEAGKVERVGLLATQGIRGGANRRVWSGSRRPATSSWPGPTSLGARGRRSPRLLRRLRRRLGDRSGTLDGQPVATINANLTAGVDLTQARPARENLGIAFMGDTKGGPFDIPADVAQAMLRQPEPGRAQQRRRRAALGERARLTRRPRDMWIIDFGRDMPIEEAALYEAPFEYVKEHVEADAVENAARAYASDGGCTSSRGSGDAAGARRALTATSPHPRCPSTGSSSGSPAGTLPDHAADRLRPRRRLLLRRAPFVRARAVGARAGHAAARVESGFRYTPTTTFETFPFPADRRTRRDEIAERPRRRSTSCATAGSIRAGMAEAEARPSAHSPTSTTSGHHGLHRPRAARPGGARRLRLGVPARTR